jgi:hypothetical protein
LAGFVRERFQLVICGVDADVRIEQEEVKAIELSSIDFGSSRQVEHGIQIDRRFGTLAFADDTGPGRIVELGEAVAHVDSIFWWKPANRANRWMARKVYFR